MSQAGRAGFHLLGCALFHARRTSARTRLRGACAPLRFIPYVRTSCCATALARQSRYVFDAPTTDCVRRTRLPRTPPLPLRWSRLAAPRAPPARCLVAASPATHKQAHGKDTARGPRTTPRTAPPHSGGRHIRRAPHTTRGFAAYTTYYRACLCCYTATHLPHHARRLHTRTALPLPRRHTPAPHCTRMPLLHMVPASAVDVRGSAAW